MTDSTESLLARADVAMVSPVVHGLQHHPAWLLVRDLRNRVVELEALADVQADLLQERLDARLDASQDALVKANERCCVKMAVHEGWCSGTHTVDDDGSVECCAASTSQQPSLREKIEALRDAAQKQDRAGSYSWTSGTTGAYYAVFALLSDTETP